MAARRPTARLAAGLGLAALWAVGFAGPARAQGGLTFSVSPADLQLRQPGVLEVRVSEAPPASGYQVELGWDPTIVAVTSVAPGEFLNLAADTVFSPHFAGDGRLVLAEVLQASPSTGSYPSGNGTLAYVTFAPLGSSGSTEITLTDANLVGPAGEGLPAAVTVGGRITVEAAPPAEQTAAVEQATALAAQLGSTEGGGAGGLGSRLADSLPQVSVPALGNTLIWVGLLAVAVLVAVAAWAIGRRPPGAGLGRR